MAFAKLNMLLNNAAVAASGSRGLNEIMELVKANPDDIAKLSSSEKGLLILFVAGLGMAVTFAVLLFLWFAISMLSKVLNAGQKKPEKVVKVEENIPAPVASSASEEEDEELIAVIAAAVAASMNTSIHNIVVRNVVRVGDHSPSWAKTGRIEQINTRFNN